jgi:hypothetical protein
MSTSPPVPAQGAAGQLYPTWIHTNLGIDQHIQLLVDNALHHCRSGFALLEMRGRLPTSEVSV